MTFALAAQRHLPVIVALGLALNAAAGPAEFKHKVPDEFRPLDKVLPLETGPLVARSAIDFDLAEGTTIDDCPQGVWTGSVRYLGHAGGTVEYTGTFLRCFPFGSGEVRYPDGSTYLGQVNSYVLGDASTLDARNSRMAVREGRGRFTRADGTVADRSFKRGTAADSADDGRIVAFRAAVAALEQQAGAPLPAPDGAPLASSAPTTKPAKKKSGGFLGELEKLAGGTLAGVDKLDKKGVDAMGKLKTSSDKADGKVAAAMGEASAIPSPFPATSTPATPLPGQFVQPQARGAASCLTGTWQRRICGGATVAELGFSGGSDGRGYFKDADCAAVCPQGRRFDFRYALASDGTLRLEYTGGQVCGEPLLPQGGQQPFECAGSTLRFGADFRRTGDRFTGGQ